jgi:hypothetical protein
MAAFTETCKLELLTDSNLAELRKLHSVLFPALYPDAFYKQLKQNFTSYDASRVGTMIFLLSI